MGLFFFVLWLITYKIETDRQIILNLKGRAIFHEVIINTSYRTRGKEHRTHTNIIHIIRVFTIVLFIPINTMVVRNLKNIIIPYSLIKINANIPPPYSILNPDTISDSPSARSKGVRLVSAMHSIIQVIIRGRDIHINHIFCCINFNCSILNDLDM